MARLGLPCAGYVDYNGVSLPVNFAAVDVATSGDNTLVAAATGYRYIVLSMFFITASAVNVTLKSGASTSLTGAMNFPANGGVSLPFNQGGWVQTASGEALVVNLSGNVSIDGGVSYIKVPV